MVAAERLDKKMILPIFDYCDVAWYGCGKDNPDALESLQHRAAQLIFRNSGLDTKLELNDTFGLVPRLIGITYIVVTEDPLQDKLILSSLLSRWCAP